MVKAYQTLFFCLIAFIIYPNCQAQKLYFSDNGVVKRMNLNGTGVETIIPSGGDYIAVDGNNNLLFHNDGQQTYSTFLDGTSPQLITDDGAMAGYANLCVIPNDESLVYVGIPDMDDLWSGGYYSNPATPPTLLNITGGTGGEAEYVDVAYHEGEEKIYFTGSSGAVYSALQNGTDAMPIVTTNAHGPIGVDYLNGKVYWVRYVSPNYYIMNADLDGSNPNTVLSNGNFNILSLDVYPEQNAVFFSQGNSIFRMALDGTGKTSILTGGTYIANVAIDFDVTPPAFYLLGPLDGAPNILVNSDLSLFFTETVKKSNATPGTTDDFSFRIYKTAGNILVETIDRGSVNISSGNKVTINPTTTLEYNTDYYVLAGNKTISDFTNNNWTGITLSTTWNFKTGPDPTIFYSRQNGAWNNGNTWSHVNHTGPVAGAAPGIGATVIIGNGHTVTLAGNTNFVANTPTGTWIKSGATLDAASHEFTVWGTLNIEGQLLNGGILTGDFDLHATGNIPVFDEIRYGVLGGPAGADCNIYTHVVALDGIQSVNGGTINTNGFQICVPPTPPPSVPLFSNITPTSITLSWTAGGGQAFVLAREGSTSFSPSFGQAYTANATFGSGQSVGTGNFLVYSGAGNTVTITGLTPATYYEFDLYSYSTSIGGCYSIQNFEFASSTSCIVVPAPTGAVNAQYCTGDTKPALTVNAPTPGQIIRWYDAPTGGNIVNGDLTGGAGMGEVFIPVAPSGTFYAEAYDEELQCTSTARTPVTLTLHPPMLVATALVDQNVCNGGDPTVIDGGVASGGTGTYTYLWETSTASAGPYSPIASAIGATYDPPAGITQTTYYRRLTFSSTCLQTGGPVMISVQPAPAITTQPVSAQVCEGQSANFSVAATGTSLGYQWQANSGAGFANISNGGNYSGATTNLLQILDATGLNNVRYQCVVNSGGSCGVTTNAVPLVVNPRPVVANQTLAVCEGVAGSGIATVNLSTLNTAVAGGAIGVTVNWFTDAGLSTRVSSPSSASATNNAIFYAMVANSSTGCSNTATATITVNSKPAGIGSISGPLSLCVDIQNTYTALGITNALRYNWQVTAGLEILSQNGTSATIRGVSGTTGTITVTGENSCGLGTATSITVQISTPPDLQIVAPAEVLVNEPAAFSFQTSGAAPKSVLWDFGDNATSTDTAPQHTYTAEGNYDVTLTAISDNNCEAVESTTILVLPLAELNEMNIKNVITANGDDKNGYLYIESIEKYPANQVVLLDRWGVEVFKKDNYVNNWDARKNGEFLPPGQYVCVVKLNETGKIFSRTVSIIKR